MKFSKLLIENFLAITKAELDLTDRGLVLIQGQNLDDSSAKSNGDGKSTIADALSWVLYGVTARDVSGDDVINAIAGKGTRVQVDVVEGDDVYRIARHRKHAKHKNSVTILHLAKDGTITDLTKGTDKLTQPVIDKVIGSSHEVFRSSVYAAQEQMPNLPALSDKPLKVLIEEAAGVTLLEDAYKEARSRYTLAEGDVNAAKAELARVEQRIADENDNLVTATARRDSWTLDRQTTLGAKKAEIRVSVDRVKALDVAIAKTDEHALVDGIMNCDQALSDLGDEQREYTRLQRLFVQATTAHESRKRELQLIKNRHDVKKGELADVNAKIGQPCDECGRDHTKDTMEAAKKAILKAGDDIAKEYAAKKHEVEAANTEVKERERDLSKFEGQMTDPTATTAKRKDLQDKLDALNSLKNERRVEAARAKSLGDETKRLVAEQNPHVQILEDIEKEVARLEQVRADATSKLQKSENLLAISDVVMKVFAPSGVRAHILDEVTPYLNQQTSKYLDTMSDGNIQATWTTLVKNAKGDLREKFSIEVVNDKGAKSFAGLSGGEKRKVRISTALALQDLVATRATKPIELFIGDEIDDALDPAGLERLTNILAEKAKERGSVFVISHTDLKDWISQVVTVKKENGATTLIEETV